MLNNKSIVFAISRQTFSDLLKRSNTNYLSPFESLVTAIRLAT